MALKLSVIVCAHNEARWLPACLHSLLAQTRLPDELLVVNNANTDETRAVAEQIPRVRRDFHKRSICTRGRRCCGPGSTGRRSRARSDRTSTWP